MTDPLLSILFEIPHLRFVALGPDGYCLIVEGTEVNDYVEDLLWDDYEFTATSVSMETEASIPLYYNYLAADLPVAAFVEALRVIDAVAVERVFRQNH